MEVLSNSDELRVRGKDHTSQTLATRASRELLLRMLAEGQTLKHACRVLGKSYHSMSKVAKQPEFLEALKALNVQMYAELDAELKLKAETTAARIQQESDAALDKLLELMEGADSEVVQMRCAQDLLDRNPDTSKTKKIEKTTKNLTLSAEFLHLVETSEREAGTTIDG